MKITGDYVLGRLEAMGVPNPTKDNLTVHWGKHCEVQDVEDAEQNADDLDDAFAALLDGNHTEVDVDAALRAVFKVGLRDIARQYREGRLKIGVAELRQIADTLERRRKTDAESELLRTFGQGMSLAFEAFARGRAPGELIDVQPTNEEEGEVVPLGELTQGS